MAAAKLKTKSPAKPKPATPSPGGGGSADLLDDRRSDDRRTHTGDDVIDRRAFWRPTPDRRREATELGRRTGDAE